MGHWLTCRGFTCLEFCVKMSTDDRNFRSAYYERVGCRGVEERKSLDILLKEKPLNRSKLKQFCLSFSVPACYRNSLWNILLGKPTYVILFKWMYNNVVILVQNKI